MASKTDESLNTYQYEAISPSGARLKGSRARMEAYSPEAVRRELTSQGFIPIEIKQVSKNNLMATLNGTNKPAKLKTSMMAAFTRSLHELISAGISVPRALQTMAEDAPNAAVSNLCLDMSAKVAAGSSLTEAFAAHPKAFDEVFIAYVSAGERTGSLPDSLSRLAELYERRAKMKVKVMSVAIYPLMISIVIGLMVIGIMLFLVPQFEEVYSSFGAELPGPTQRLIAISKVMPFVVLIGGGAVAGLITWLRREVKANSAIGVRWTKLKYRLPVMGKLSKNLAMYRWSTTMSGALEAGLRMGLALELAAAASGSAWLRSLTGKFASAVESGHMLSSLLADEPGLFTPQMRTMISTGEQTGELPKMLDSGADTVNNAIDSKVATMGAQLEVLLLIGMAVVVGGLLIVLYLPILNLSSSIGESFN